ncbi:hypothetical protein PPERSA_03793 [Pseudocohnilembus persalinus]|uniref:EF-hand domain-containing protein n=1 Tax=Pseudocohnilembus persalinus TaxID=266149 RepID=A0A0V0QV47_PSEPJ|nr:hypothetical protein PPERSA_03793 [Pseudocohnilembus persalinus]|eukprot:KRX05856.1 hypothetical protein PPERSA_03793 [Pseudocohnilembus persalinus]
MLKNTSIIFVIFSLLLLVQFTQQVPQEDRIFLVDQLGQNLLFRGNDPTKNGKFDYEGLVEIFKTKTQEQGLEFYKEFKLTVISVLQDSQINVIEYDYFNNNSELGYYLNYPLTAEYFGYPGDYSKTQQQIIAQSYKSWTVDNLGQIAVMIRQQLEYENKEVPTIVYYHCASGINLVHEPFGGYQMVIKGWTNKQIVDWYTEQNIPFPAQVYQNAVNWFCLYYSQENDIQDNDCLYQKLN